MTRKSDFGGAYFVDLADPRITAETREEWRLRADAETIARVQQETADARQAARDELNAALGGETCAYGCGRPVTCDALDACKLECKDGCGERAHFPEPCAGEAVDTGRCMCGRPEAEPGAGYCSGFLSGKGPCTDDP